MYIDIYINIYIYFYFAQYFPQYFPSVFYLRFLPETSRNRVCRSGIFAFDILEYLFSPSAFANEKIERSRGCNRFLCRTTRLFHPASLFRLKLTIASRRGRHCRGGTESLSRMYRQ